MSGNIEKENFNYNIENIWKDGEFSIENFTAALQMMLDHWLDEECQQSTTRYG